MRRWIPQLFNYRVRALMRKEFNQIRHDRRLAVSLILPPTLQLLLFGFALSANVSNIRLGVVDDSRTPESRELVATLTESKSFQLAGGYFSVDQLGDAITRGKVDAGVVIPSDYARDLQRGRSTTVQFLLNAMNANTAAISQGYAQGLIQAYNSSVVRRPLSVAENSVAHATGSTTNNRQRATDSVPVNHRGQVLLHPAFLY